MSGIFFSMEDCVTTLKRLVQGVVLYTYGLFAAISKFEIKNNLCQPYIVFVCS